MKKLVVIAEAEEIKLVKELNYEVTEGAPILITGVGALNVIDALKDIPRDTAIINIGYAGSKNLEPGKFYAIDRSGLYHPNVNYTEPMYDLPTVPFVGKNTRLDFVKCLTGTDFVLQSDVDDCVFDMELAYIKALGFENVIAFKYVSDNLDLQEHRETVTHNLGKELGVEE